MGNRAGNFELLYRSSCQCLTTKFGVEIFLIVQTAFGLASNTNLAGRYQLPIVKVKRTKHLISLKNALWGKTDSFRGRVKMAYRATSKHISQR